MEESADKAGQGGRDARPDRARIAMAQAAYEEWFGRAGAAMVDVVRPNLESSCRHLRNEAEQSRFTFPAAMSHALARALDLHRLCLLHEFSDQFRTPTSIRIHALILAELEAALCCSIIVVLEQPPPSSRVAELDEALEIYRTLVPVPDPRPRNIDDILVAPDAGRVSLIDVNADLCESVPLDLNPLELDEEAGMRSEFLARAADAYEGVEEDRERNLGGLNLLAQLSFFKWLRSGVDTLFSPAALNLHIDEHADSLFNLANDGQIDLIEVTGTGYDRPDAISLRLRNNTEDPLRIRIPQGAMFEQKMNNPNQALVADEEQFLELGPEEEGQFALRACCANSMGGAPSGDAMQATNFVFGDLGGTFEDQAQIWRSFDGIEVGETASAAKQSDGDGEFDAAPVGSQDGCVRDPVLAWFTGQMVALQNAVERDSEQQSLFDELELLEMLLASEPYGVGCLPGLKTDELRRQISLFRQVVVS